MLKQRNANRFNANVELCKKRKYDMAALKEVIKLLVNEQPLPKKHRNHKLQGQRVERWECHVKGDWLLFYRYDKDTIIFEATGTHSDLF